MRQIIHKIVLFFSVRWFNFCDWTYNFFHYYSHIRFAMQETLLLLFYFLSSPYRIARRFFEKSEEQGACPYGETPHKTLHAIVKAADITLNDVVYDLGCGRGRSCFWLANVMRCKVVGIEYNPTFVKKARIVQKLLPMPSLKFRLENMLDTNLHDATAIYIYAISLPDSDIKELAEKLKSLPKKPVIITISFSLNEYLPAAFRVIKKMQVTFPWGKTTCYIQRH